MFVELKKKNLQRIKKKFPFLERLGQVGVTAPDEPHVGDGFCLGPAAESEQCCARGVGGPDPAGSPVAGC